MNKKVIVIKDIYTDLPIAVCEIKEIVEYDTLLKLKKECEENRKALVKERENTFITLNNEVVHLRDDVAYLKRTDGEATPSDGRIVIDLL